MLRDGVPLQSAYKTLQGVRWEIGGGKEAFKTPNLTKKELKLAFGIEVIFDHVEIHPPTFCKPCKLSMERVLNALRQKKLVPFRWSCPTSGKSICVK